MNTRVFVGVVLALSFLVTAPAWATTRYVDATAGTCSGNYSIANRNCTGSDGNSYATIAAGVSATASGDTLNIRTGTYNATMSNTITGGVSAASPTIIQGYNAEIFTLAATSGVQTIYLLNDSYVTLRRFIIDGGAGTSNNPIKIESSVGIVIEDCELKNGVFSGLLVTSGSNNGVVRRCNIHNNGSTVLSHGIYLGAGSGVSGWLIEHNSIHDNSGFCMQAYPIAPNNTVRYNEFYGCTTGVIMYKTGNIFEYNIVRGNSADGLDTPSDSSGTIIRHNIFYGNATRGIWIRPSSNNHVLQNNISVGNGTNLSNQGTNTTLTTNKTTGSITDCTVSTSNFVHKAGSSCIGAGTALSGVAYNGSAPDQGAFETFGFSSAKINEALMDVTVGMNLNTPVLPSTGPSGFTVGCTGVNCGTPVVASATRLTGTSSVLRLVITGIGGGGVCTVGQTWTVSNSGVGNVTDSAKIGNVTNQPMVAFTTQSVTNGCGTAPPSPPAGLNIHYKMDDGSGTNLNDETANNLDGTASGTFAWGLGHTGTGITLTDATTGGVAVPYGSGVNPSTQSLTIAFGVDIPANLISASRVYTGTTLGTDQRFYVSTIDGTWRIGIQGSADWVATSNLAVGEGWNRVCIVANSATDTATLSVNGTAGTGGASKAYTSYIFPANLTIGSPFNVTRVPGVTYDDFKLWTSAESCADDFAAWEPVSPPSTGTIAQVAHQWQRLRQTSGGAAENYGAVSATMPVMVGGAVSLMVQTDCTTGNCSAFGAKLYYNVNGGAFNPVPNTMGADQVEFYTNPDVDVFQGVATCCLSGVLSANHGTTNTTADAVPVNDLTQDSSVVQRFVIRTGTTTTAQTICFKLYDQNGNALSSSTPSAGACMTVVGVAGAMGF